VDDFVFARAYWSLNAKGGLRFTLPPIAAVGLPEAAAREQAPKLRVNSAKVPDWYTAGRIGESVYGYKTLVEEDSGRASGRAACRRGCSTYSSSPFAIISA
jgi:pyruvate/2-oxoglutarate dehydrogenase complex dihydrolipoamide dehydrogenase (E3) component